MLSHLLLSGALWKVTDSKSPIPPSAADNTKFFQPSRNEAELKGNKCLFCPSNCRIAVRMKRTGSAWNKPSQPSWTCSAAWNAFTASTRRGAGLGKHPQEINHFFLLENLIFSFSRHVLLPVFFVDGAAAQNLHVLLVKIMWIFYSFSAKVMHVACLELN